MIRIQLPEALMFAGTVLSTRIIDTTTSAFGSFSNGKTVHFLFTVDIDIDTYFFFISNSRSTKDTLDDASMECQRNWMHVGLLIEAVEPVAASRPVCGSTEKTTRLFEP